MLLERDDRAREKYPVDVDRMRGADRIGEWWAQGLDVDGSFNNDGEGHAVRNIRRVRELVHGAPPEGEPG